MVDKDESFEDIQNKIIEQMNVIYRIVGICLGVPNEKFTWSYYDKSKQFHKIGPITALEFYEKYVKPVFNLDDKVHTARILRRLAYFRFGRFNRLLY